MEQSPTAPRVPEASPRVRRIQRTALALLLLSGVINYIDRATLSIANPLIRHDLGLSVAEMGLLLSAFLWAYAFAQLPAGALVDRFGARVMLSVGLATWSVAQAFGGVVSSFGQFFAARMVLGIGEAPQFPTAAKVVRDWFGKKERGAATGIWNSSSTLGTAISAPLVTVLMLTVGWRWMFGVMGIAGLLVGLGFYLLHRDPHQVELTQRERAYLSEVDGEAQSRPTWHWLVDGLQAADFIGRPTHTTESRNMTDSSTAATRQMPATLLICCASNPVHLNDTPAPRRVVCATLRGNACDSFAARNVRSRQREHLGLAAWCVFHIKLDKDFAASCTGFSHEAGHGFHGKLDSDFAPGWTVRS